jgi:hypothetical protein
MNIKKTINFKELRDKGVSALNIKGDEIVQVFTKEGVACIVDQEYLFGLFAEIEKLKEKNGEKIPTTKYDSNSLNSLFEAKLSGNIMGSAGLTRNKIDKIIDHDLLISNIEKDAAATKTLKESINKINEFIINYNKKEK